jgi:hypothetical protein
LIYKAAVRAVPVTKQTYTGSTPETENVNKYPRPFLNTFSCGRITISMNEWYQMHTYQQQEHGVVPVTPALSNLPQGCMLN